jgi:pentose-5-phosphate-3-epimerase
VLEIWKVWKVLEDFLSEKFTMLQLHTEASQKNLKSADTFKKLALMAEAIKRLRPNCRIFSENVSNAIFFCKTI